MHHPDAAHPIPTKEFIAMMAVLMSVVAISIDAMLPALGWFLSTRSAKWMLERVDRITEEVPFKLAACYQGKLSKEVRGLLGERDFPREHCPALRKE